MNETNDTTRRGAHSRTRAFVYCTLAYVVALAGALVAGWAAQYYFADLHPIAVAAIADVIGTLIVFAFSVRFDNSSIYDPYWSVAPLPIVVYWSWLGLKNEVALYLLLVVGALVLLWGARLTYNWARGWQGLDHEDWRYVDIRRQTGRAYWPASLGAIHLLPTAMVFGGLLPLYPVLAGATVTVNASTATGLHRAVLWSAHGAAIAITLTAIWIEATADKQLRRFKLTRKKPGETLQSGLWATSRHPNYFGEVLFWWGLAVFVIPVLPAYAWTLVGPLAITGLFLCISIPLIDRRMLARHPDYEKRMNRISRLIPWFPRKPD
jgi:steroid 5-alpha reductase family enzyme